MSFNKDTNTITLDKNSDFLVDAGVFFIHILRKTTLSGDSPSELNSDWKIIANWLELKNDNITPEAEVQIGKAWKAYLAIGLAPSFKLQEAFNHYSEQYKKSDYSFKSDKPSTEVMDVFDRLLATDQEISVKREHDWAEEKKKIEAVFKQFPKNKLTLKQKVHSLSKSSRIIIASSLAWFVWVSFRTIDDWEILGMYLDDWNADMFFANVFLPIMISITALKTYKWIAGAKK